MKAILGAVLALFAPDALAQDHVRVEASVSAVAGGSVYLDRGRAAGIETSDRVILRPPGASSGEGIVRAVSKNSSRVELLPGSPSIEVGVRAEVLVPAERLRAKPPPATGPQRAGPGSADAPTSLPPPAEKTAEPAPLPEPETPPHPPWSHPPENWDEEMPLLAPAFGVGPQERDRKWTGRAYTRWNANFGTDGEKREFHLGSLGVDARLENPFGDGGALDVDAEVFHRVTDVEGSGDDDDTRFLLKRFSYFFGGTEEEPGRWQFGRFLHNEFPELGVVDGVEWSHRTDGGHRFGASVGGLPEPFPEMDSFESLGASVFQRWIAGEDERLALGAAYQNTWHRGDQDRNLFLGTLDWRPNQKLALHAGTWVDYYGPNDEIKSDGFELTELQVQGSYRIGERSGASASFSHVRWPELLRDEFTEVSAERLEDNRVDRASLSGWHGFTDRLRLNARVDVWQDQSDEGTNGEIGASVQDLLWERGQVAFSVFRADGTYSSGPGFRVSANRAFGSSTASLSYEFVDYEQKDFSGEQASLAHQAVFGSLDLDLGDDWDLSLLGDFRFGDEVEGFGLGFLLQRRF